MGLELADLVDLLERTDRMDRADLAELKEARAFVGPGVEGEEVWGAVGVAAEGATAVMLKDKRGVRLYIEADERRQRGGMR